VQSRLQTLDSRDCLCPAFYLIRRSTLPLEFFGVACNQRRRPCAASQFFCFLRLDKQIKHSDFVSFSLQLQSSLRSAIIATIPKRTRRNCHPPPDLHPTTHGWLLSPRREQHHETIRQQPPTIPLSWAARLSLNLASPFFLFETGLSDRIQQLP
jgi:hypothetical protein